MHEHMVTMDPPEHTRHRAVLMRLITPRRLKENEEFMWRLADRQLDEFLAKGQCEFITEYSQPFAMLVIADLLGVPETDHPSFRRRLNAQAGAISGEQMEELNALASLDEWFKTYIEDRRREPREDVLTGLALAKYPDGSTPEVIDVVRTATFLFAAGQETTARLLATALKHLAEHPEVQDELRAHRDRIPDFIEEALRIESPVKTDFRLTRRSTTPGRRGDPRRHPAHGAERRGQPGPAAFRAPRRVPHRPPQRQAAHRLRPRRPCLPGLAARALRGEGQPRADPRPDARHSPLGRAPRSGGRPALRVRADLGPARPAQPSSRVHAGAPREGGLQ